MPAPGFTIDGHGPSGIIAWSRTSASASLEIGFRSRGPAAAHSGPSRGRSSGRPSSPIRSFWSSNEKLADESLVLMGDQNIIDIAFSVQYRVTDAVRFLYGVANPDEMVRNVSTAVLRSILATMDVDAIYTTARLEVETRLMRAAQEVLDRYRSGIRLVTSAS